MLENNSEKRINNDNRIKADFIKQVYSPIHKDNSNGFSFKQSTIKANNNSKIYPRDPYRPTTYNFDPSGLPSAAIYGNLTNNNTHTSNSIYNNNDDYDYYQEEQRRRQYEEQEEEERREREIEEDRCRREAEEERRREQEEEERRIEDRRRLEIECIGLAIAYNDYLNNGGEPIQL